MPLAQEGHLGLFGYCLALDFVMFHSRYQILGQLLLDVAGVTAVQHHRVAVLVREVGEIIQRYHTVFHAEIVHVLMDQRVVRLVSEGAAAYCYVVEKAAGPAVGGVHRA